MPTSKNFSASKKYNQSGIFHIWLIFGILAALIASWALYTQFKPVIKPAPSNKPTVTAAPSTPSSTPIAQQTQKGDLVALEKYCKEEALKLPEVPFTYKSKTGPLRSGPMPWVDQFIPKDKKPSEKISYTVTYVFDGRTAYGQMGAEYPGQIIKFDKAVRAGLVSKIDSSWEKVSGPSISNDGFNMVYKRENPQMGTVDYLDAFDGGLSIFIKFNTYYK